MTTFCELLAANYFRHWEDSPRKQLMYQKAFSGSDYIEYVAKVGKKVLPFWYRDFGILAERSLIFLV